MTEPLLDSNKDTVNKSINKSPGSRHTSVDDDEEQKRFS